MGWAKSFHRNLHEKWIMTVCICIVLSLLSDRLEQASNTMVDRSRGREAGGTARWLQSAEIVTTSVWRQRKCLRCCHICYCRTRLWMQLRFNPAGTAVWLSCLTWPYPDWKAGRKERLCHTNGSFWGCLRDFVLFIVHLEPRGWN